MKPTRKLPDSFVRYDRFGRNQYKKAVQWLVVLTILVAVPWYILFNWIAKVLRPDFGTGLRFNPSFKFESIAMMLIIFAICAVLHELTHVVFLWPGLDERPRIAVGWVYVRVKIDTWYLPRNRFLVANLAPFCLLTLAGLVALLIVPETAMKAMVFGLTVNAAGSTPDLISSVFASLLPASSYVTTSGALYIEKRYLEPQGREGKVEWKWQPFLERILSRFSQ